MRRSPRDELAGWQATRFANVTMGEFIVAFLMFGGIALVVFTSIAIALKTVLVDAAKLKQQSGRRWYQYSAMTLLVVVLCVSATAAFLRVIYQETIGRERERRARLINCMSPPDSRPDDPQKVSFRRRRFEFTSQRPFALRVTHDPWNPKMDHLKEYMNRFGGHTWPRKSATSYRVPSRLREKEHLACVEIEADIHGWRINDKTVEPTALVVSHNYAVASDKLGTRANFAGSSQFERERTYGVFMIITSSRDRKKPPVRPPFWQREDWIYIDFDDP